MSDITATLGLPPDDVAEVLTTAGLAPSLHNSQPWAFRVTPDAIELHADPDRRLPAADGQDRELRIACGAVLLNLRLALQGKGVRPEVTRMPDHTRPGFVAEIRRGGAAPVTPEAARLAAWVQSRGSEKVELHAGQTVYCPPGEEHWHGAAPDSFMEHLAMLDNADDPATTTTWLQHVTDDDYLA